MKFHVYALNWNEERLLPVFFEHYKQADKIYILDNESTDSSRDIIKAYGRDYISFSTNGTLDDAKNAQIKNSCWKQSKGQADFVIIQDLDEFLYFPKFPNDIIAGLEELKSRGITVCKTRGFQMFCSDEDYNTVFESKQSITSQIWTGTNGFLTHDYDKITVFNPNSFDSVHYEVGAHSATFNGDYKLDNTSTLLLHYKYIGRKYLIDRWLKIRDRISNNNRSHYWGHQYYKYTVDKTIADLHSLFDKYIDSSIFRIMYPDMTVGKYQFKSKRCVIKTYGKSDILSKFVLEDAIWEPSVAEYIHSKCSQSDTLYIDIGCNIGTHMCIARLSGAKYIHVFECNPHTYEKIQSTIQMNGWDNIKSWNVAVSDSEGTVPFTVVTDNIGASYIPTTHKGWGGPLSVLKEGVKATTFDSLNINTAGFKTAIIKMDIEGHELQALHGMRNILLNPIIKSIIMEINYACTDMATVEKILDILDTNRFTKRKLLFHVPGNSWAGAELKSLPNFNEFTRNDILSMFSHKIIMEIAFERSAD